MGDAEFNCTFCRAAFQVRFVVPGYREHTLTKVKCKRCESEFILKLSKMRTGLAGNSLDQFLKVTKKTVKAEEFEKINKARFVKSNNPYDRMT